MKTNELHPETPDDLPLLTAAVASYLNPVESREGRHAGDCSPAIATPSTAPIYAARHEAVEWQDLAATAPGAAARERAMAERTAAPVRSVLARILGVHTDERAWRIGADGEEAVAAQLAKLGESWRVLHAVPVGENGADIDHVVIGPAGVFTVNAKNHPNADVWVGGNTFMVNGQRTYYIRNSRHEAARAARLLGAAAGRPIEVQAIIAVMGAQRGLTIKQQPQDGAVYVVARKKIAGYLANLPPRLAPDEIEALHTLARRSTTWRPPAQ